MGRPEREKALWKVLFAMLIDLKTYKKEYLTEFNGRWKHNKMHFQLFVREVLLLLLLLLLLLHFLLKCDKLKHEE